MKCLALWSVDFGYLSACVSSNYIPPFNRTQLIVEKPKVKFDFFSEGIMSFTNVRDKDIHAISVAGNGNCLFNSVSLVISGTEVNASLLRLHACIELVRYRSFYEEMKHLKDADAFRQISPDYSEATCDCAKPGRFSSLWIIMALATVINLPIRSVFPQRKDSYAPDLLAKLNCTFYPRTGPYNFSENEVVTVLWTSFPRKYTPVWSPDHFVPVVRCSGGTFVPVLMTNATDSTNSPVMKTFSKSLNNINMLLW